MAHRDSSLPRAGVSSPGVRVPSRVGPLLQRVAAFAESRRGIAVCLVLILAWAAALRFSGQDWDQGQHLHPDERFLTMVETAISWPEEGLLGTYFDEAHSTLNPRNV